MVMFTILCDRLWGPFMARGDKDMAITNGPGGPSVLPQVVRGTVSFGNRWSGGTAHRGDRS